MDSGNLLIQITHWAGQTHIHGSSRVSFDLSLLGDHYQSGNVGEV
jgi:hypothetical protein